MSDADRSIEMEIEVRGSPEQVWRAIATGPGITSWYVPHTVEEQDGGTMTASFGPGPEMQVEGRVAAWDPPHRVVFDGGEGVPGLAFEWTVETRAPGTCIVRLVNRGFGSGEDADAHHDAMAEGWTLFLRNLQLHLEHFAGRTATAALPSAMWAGPRDETWQRLLDELGIDAAPTPGARADIGPPEGPTLGGTVVDAASGRLVLLVDQPAPGTAFVTAEGRGDHIMVSIWSYLYGAEGATAAGRDAARWQDWLTSRGVPGD